MRIVEVLLLWAAAALVLSEYEINVAVLRPWKRWAFGVLAFFAGLAILGAR